MIVAGDGSTKLTNWEQMQARKRARELEDTSAKDSALEQHVAALASEGKSKFSLKPKTREEVASILSPTSPLRDELTGANSRKKISFRTMTLNPRMTVCSDVGLLKTTLIQ